MRFAFVLGIILAVTGCGIVYTAFNWQSYKVTRDVFTFEGTQYSVVEGTATAHGADETTTRRALLLFPIDTPAAKYDGRNAVAVCWDSLVAENCKTSFGEQLQSGESMGGGDY